MANLNELMVFLAAAETGSFSEAGRKLHLSQPAVSQTIAGMEKRCGLALFVRQGRAARLSEAGQALVPLARELLAAARRVDEAMASFKGQVVGELQVGCAAELGHYLLPALIARFRRRFPQVQVNVRACSREALIAGLLEGALPLGLVDQPDDSGDLEWAQVYTDEVILIAPPDHPWSRSPAIQASDLANQALIFQGQPAEMGKVLLEGLPRGDLSPQGLKVAMTLGSAESVVMAVEAGLGAAFAPRLAAQRSLELGRVVEAPLAGLALSQPVYLARSRRFPLAPSQAAFWDSALQAFQSPGGGPLSAS